jgi:5-methylthioadenosine/S-adenosylhomocysteine deaminase
MKTLITEVLIVPMSAETGDARKYFTGSVALEGNRISMVADDASADDRRRVAKFRVDHPDAKMIDGRGKLLMPGLINTHTHAAMTLMRNFADDLPLMEWLHQRVWPFEAQLGSAEIATGSRLGIAEMMLGGTTTLVDMYWHEAAVARVARDMGVRAVLCPSYVDGPRMAEFESDLQETLKVAAGCDRLSVRVAPHAAYSCSEENLRRGVALAHRHNLGMHIHVSETLDEQRIIRDRHGLTPTEYLLGMGLFERPVIAAHCVHASDRDMEIMRSHGVSVAHNPQSNMKLARGAAPIARMVARGLNVSLGTDGASSNNDLDMWDEMRSASLLGKLTTLDPAALPAYEILKMATVNGAVAIGMAGSLGIVAEGALADLILLDTRKPHWQPLADPLAALVYSAKASDVHTVWIDGRPTVSGGRPVGLDLDAIMHDARNITHVTFGISQK